MENAIYIKWCLIMVELGFMTGEELDTTFAELKVVMYEIVDVILRWIRTLTLFLVAECGMK